MNWNDFASPRVRIEYANLAKINRVRAWARRNGATVQVSRYARDAYEGHVKIHAPWDERKSVTDGKVADLKTLLQS